MHKKEGINYSGRLLALIAIALISSLLMLMVTTLAMAEEELATLTVTKTVSGDAYPGGTLNYTIVIANTDAGFATPELVDTLPMSLTYVADSLNSSDAAMTLVENSGVITSATGYALNPDNQVTVTFKATIAETAALGSVITNTAVVTNAMTSAVVMDDAVVTVVKQTNPVDLFVAKKIVGGDYLPGGTLEYSIVVSSTAATVRPFTITDTLPAGVTYITDSLSSSAGFNVTEAAGVISSAEYFLNPGTTVEATFEVMIDASAVVSSFITNTVMMQDTANDLLLENSIGAMVITMTVPTTYYMHLPLLFKAYSPPIMESIPEPSNNENKWTLTWTDEHTGDANVTGYQIEEATDAAFTQNVAVIEVGRATSTEITKPLANPTTYYYRIRTMATGILNGTGGWSGTRTVESFFFYEDTFSDSSNPSDWRVVREDSDTVINELTVSSTDPGYLDLRMKSRYDYMIASDLTELPTAPFKLTARMRLEDADPRHTGGIILGGNYDGTSSCPVDRDGHDFSSCFTQYYRIMFIAGNLPSQIQVAVKRIEEHASDDNSGSGVDLGSVDLNMTSATRSSWIEWTVEVSADGEMLIRRDGSEVLTVKDTEYQANRYFGFWSSTSDTSFSNTQIDWVKVEQQ